MEQRWTGHCMTTKCIVDNCYNIVSLLKYFSETSEVDLPVTAVDLPANGKNESLFLCGSNDESLFCAQAMMKVYFCAQAMIIFLALLTPADKMLQSKVTSLATTYCLIKTTILEVKKLRNEVEFEKIIGEVRKKDFDSGSAFTIKNVRRKTLARMTSPSQTPLVRIIFSELVTKSYATWLVNLTKDCPN